MVNSNQPASIYVISMRLPGKRKYIPMGFVETMADARLVAQRLMEFRQGNSFATVSIKPSSNFSGEFDA